jgi:hypothetical protein
VVALNDDDPVSTNSAIKVLMPSGNYVVAPGSFDPNVTGPYTLGSTQTNPDINNCEEAFVVKGISAAQTLTTTDCLNSGFYSDDVFITVYAGQTVTITMQSSAFDAYLEVYSSSGLVASNNNQSSATTNAQIVFTATTTDVYLIAPTTAAAGATGAYTLIIQ